MVLRKIKLLQTASMSNFIQNSDTRINAGELVQSIFETFSNTFCNIGTPNTFYLTNICNL